MSDGGGEENGGYFTDSAKGAMKSVATGVNKIIDGGAAKLSSLHVESREFDGDESVHRTPSSHLTYYFHL